MPSRPFDDSSALGLANWEYARFFNPPPTFDGVSRLAREVGLIVEGLNLPDHPFFAVAQESRAALCLWLTQELVMTNAFSQIVLMAASREPNVHARSVLSEVAQGEHGRLRNGVARLSHPWLLNGLRESMAIPESAVTPSSPVVNFIERLKDRLDDPLHAALFIGVGNELLIVPEYEAIRLCFRKLESEANFDPFLDANVRADERHARLCLELGAMYVAQGRSEDEFLEVAAEAAMSRITYFDELVALIPTEA